MATGTSQGFAVTSSPSVAISAAVNTGVRSYILIQNSGNADVIISFGTNNAAVAGGTPNGFRLQPLQFLEKGRMGDRNAFGSAAVPQTDIAAIAVAGSTTVTILEM